jgi:hypothetical protein
LQDKNKRETAVHLIIRVQENSLPEAPITLAEAKIFFCMLEVPDSNTDWDTNYYD